MQKVLIIFSILLFFGGPATPYVLAQESQLGADFRGERERIARDCGRFQLKTITGCAVTLFTDHPVHIAVGSIAPQNGFGAGLAFVTHYTPNESWRLNWNVDAVASNNGSWRAGAYMKIIHTPVVSIQPTDDSSSQSLGTDAMSGDDSSASSEAAVRPHSALNVYAQAISLKKIYYFGEGSTSLQAARSAFKEQETIVGSSGILPVGRKLHFALYGEANGRFVDVRGAFGQDSPSTTQLFNNNTAPGLVSQPGFAQLGEGVRLNPRLLNDHVQLNYSFLFQQFLAPSDSVYSFRRWTLDLGHTFPLYGKSVAAPPDFNGPDQCSKTPGGKCPAISTSRDRKGSVGVRLLISESIAGAGSVVPFYLQPTLGGSDLNGSSYLPSFQDYRFRAPNLLLIRESFEHSIWGPFGFNFMADEGKVALTRGTIDLEDLKHSYAAGITIRAGGLPVLRMLFAWGGGETDHTIATVDPSLLGGSARPSLF